jgi:SPP1 gp7 family putative phage head morphogenesis protein
MARKKPDGRKAIKYTRAAAKRYGVALRKIAKHIGELAKYVEPQDPASVALYQNLMNRYADVIEPWARVQGAKMLDQVDRRDKANWFDYAREMGGAIKQEIEHAPTGKVYRESLQRQVTLITSLPVEAAERVHQLATHGLSNGMRADEISDRIMETGEVTKSRANLIARTEVGRASTEFTKVRATAFGSNQYIWRTVGDARVRDSHVDMEGTTQSWDAPPAPEDKEHYHPGCFPNCRCWAEPILPEED